MSDLVKRLRARKGFFLNGSRYNMATTPDTDCAEAADEIERLEHEIQSLTGWPPHIASECAYCVRSQNESSTGGNEEKI